MSGCSCSSPEGLAAVRAGAIPYYARRYTFDLQLLNVDTEVVKRTPARGNRPGHTKSPSVAQVLALDIDLLISHPTISSEPLDPTIELAGYEWFTVRVPGLDPPWWGTLRKIDPARRRDDPVGRADA